MELRGMVFPCKNTSWIGLGLSCRKILDKRIGEDEREKNDG
jgi:hypothetical protein